MKSILLISILMLKVSKCKPGHFFVDDVAKRVVTMGIENEKERKKQSIKYLGNYIVFGSFEKKIEKEKEESNHNFIKFLFCF